MTEIAVLPPEPAPPPDTQDLAEEPAEEEQEEPPPPSPKPRPALRKPRAPQPRREEPPEEELESEPKRPRGRPRKPDSELKRPRAPPPPAPKPKRAPPGKRKDEVVRIAREVEERQYEPELAEPPPDLLAFSRYFGQQLSDMKRQGLNERRDKWRGLFALA